MVTVSTAQQDPEEPSHSPPVATPTSSADSLSAMGDHCTRNPPLDASERSSGEIVKLGKTETYVSKPANTSHTTRLLVLLTNGVGVHSVNNQVQADHFAKAGYFVVMPDLFDGDPAPNGANVATAEEEQPSLLDQIKMQVVGGIKEFMIDMWLARHTPENTMPTIEKVLEAVGEEYGDKEYSSSHGISVVGYCFGGKYALRLAARDDVSVAAVAHGTMISKGDFVGVKCPITFACVENDPLFPDEIREEGIKFLNTEHELKVYKGVPHGFAVYGSYPDQHIKSSQEEVYDQFIEFLNNNGA